jgi:penicillin-binding protein-related factor A (putative recombinase)
MVPEDAASFLAGQAVSLERRRGGRVAQDHGSALEAWLDTQHAELAAAGLAHVRKVGAPVAVGRDGQPVRWAGKGPCDYLGTMRGGRTVAIEAKRREGRLSRRDIAAHQQEDLFAVHQLGGLALLLVELTTPREALGDLFAVPWGEVPWHTSERRRRVGLATCVDTSQTVGAEELAPWRVSRGGLYLAPWLPGGAHG